MTPTTEVECPRCGVTIEVEYEYERGCKASWGYHGGSPAEPETWTIGGVDCPNCDYIASPHEVERMEEQLANDLRVTLDDVREAKAEREWEERTER